MERRHYLSPVLMRIEDNPWGEYGYWCPGCEELHEVAVSFKNPSKASWQFDGNVYKPTFTPSLNLRCGPFPDNHIDVCHCFVRAGVIEFLPDCTHALRGQKVEMVPIPENYSKYWLPYKPGEETC
jgi:hypothetical protein